MATLVRWVCLDCFRSAAEGPSAEGVEGVRLCSHCGGSMEPEGAQEAEAEATPSSLQLTPEDSFWPEEAGHRCGSGRLQSVGRFQLREWLGGGGSGDVYRSFDPRLERELAIKVLRVEHPSSRVMERFFREARAAARLSHPSIVSIHDAGRDAGRCWIAYQYVTGRVLDRLIGESQPPRRFETLAATVRDLALALDHAHRQGIVHRDVKPCNVIIDNQGRPLLTDFGLARELHSEPTLTATGTILGTPAYMSPEQAAGRSHLADFRSDIFSLGVLLFELLCHERPPAASRLGDGTAQPIVSPRRYNRRIPRCLERICMRALALRPADRFSDARSMADELDHWLAAQARKPVRRILAACTIAAATAGVAVGRWSSSATWPRPAPPPALATAGPSASTPTRLRLTPRLPATYYQVGDEGAIFHRLDCPAISADVSASRARLITPTHVQEHAMHPCLICRPGG